MGTTSPSKWVGQNAIIPEPVPAVSVGKKLLLSLQICTALSGDSLFLVANLASVFFGA